MRVNEAADVEELIRGFLEREANARNREAGVEGDQGANAEDVKKYLIDLGYDEEAVTRLLRTPAAGDDEGSTEVDDEKKRKSFNRIQQHIEGGGVTRAQLMQLKRELER